MDQLVTGLTRGLPGASMQFSFIPAFNELAAVERLVRAAEDAKLRAGYLVAVKSPQVQDFFQRRPLPVVLLGMPYAGVTGLPWLDKDQRALGTLLARELIRLGHSKIGVVLRDRRGYGDDVMLDAVTHEVLDAKLGAGALVVRSVPTEPQLTEQAVRMLLNSPGRPSALICRTRMIFEATVRACEALKLRVPMDVQLALCDPISGTWDKTAVTCIRPHVQTDAVAEGIVLAEMLSSLARGEPVKPDHYVIPVTLNEPNAVQK